jgi:hypothetical protein
MGRSKDLEFAVNDASGKQRIFKNFNEACGFAVSVSATGIGDVHLDVLAYSKSAAKAWAGDEGVESYNDDPEASVFDRIVSRAESIGRVA